MVKADIKGKARLKELHKQQKNQPARPDHDGRFRKVYEQNKKRIFATQSVCGICGRPVDFSLKWPNPMCAVIDHIVPIALGGHPADIDNLQLAHNKCNGTKSTKTMDKKRDIGEPQLASNRELPQSINWIEYHH